MVQSKNIFKINGRDFLHYQKPLLKSFILSKTQKCFYFQNFCWMWLISELVLTFNYWRICMYNKKYRFPLEIFVVKVFSESLFTFENKKCLLQTFFEISRYLKMKNSPYILCSIKIRAYYEKVDKPIKILLG